jgi:sensor histidine kinase regulating citrate/malate metabolism
VADEVIGTVRVGLDTSRTSEIVAAARRRALNIVAFEIALVALISFILGT